MSAYPYEVTDDLEWIERVCKRHGPGQVKLAECPVCGYREWVGTDPSKPNSILIDAMDDFDGCRCPKCLEAHHRAPEVVQWTLDVRAKLQRDIDERIKLAIEAKVAEVEKDIGKGLEEWTADINRELAASEQKRTSFYSEEGTGP